MSKILINLDNDQVYKLGQALLPSLSGMKKKEVVSIIHYEILRFLASLVKEVGNK